MNILREPLEHAQECIERLADQQVTPDNFYEVVLTEIKVALHADAHDHSSPSATLCCPECGPAWMKAVVEEKARKNTLDCDHCGDTAIESDHGLFGEDDGEKCMSCGYPGSVRIEENFGDGPETAYWSSYDDGNSKCNNHSCEDCFPITE